MGRSPCCEKVGLKKGPWTPEEDQKLLAYIEKHGHGSWRALPAKAGLQRCGKSCRLRWTNYLRPDIKRGKFSLQEEQTIIQLHALLGNRWSAIATHLHKRTDNEIKNYWNTHLKKRLAKMGIDPVTHKPKSDNLCSSVDGRPNNDANLSHMAQWESARLEAEARLAGEATKLQHLSNSLLHQVSNAHVGLMGLGSSTSATSSSSTSSIALYNNSNINHTNNNNKFGATRLPCLDVLKAWQGFRSTTKSTTTKGGGSGGVVLESPTSTLTAFPENSMPIAAFGFAGENPNNATVVSMEFIGGNSSNSEGGMDCGEEELVGYKESMEAVLIGIDDSAWTSAMESVKSEERENVVPMTNFMDGFTDLLLGSSTADHHHNHNPERNNSSDQSGGNSDHSDECDEFDQENKNYWNNILNLVNSSPSDSGVF
ncbi:hypothetical protein Scep_017242 [Stephania cephalantha]|uniref:Uncharacterized protein n=1 Tax=Stephania cephalantha TaxID=152367 RepID=A0AAP0IP80_9MAGN